MSVGAAFGQETLRRLLAGPTPIVARLRDPEGQVQPNGIDLTVEAVWRFAGSGSIGPGRDRTLPPRRLIEPRDAGYELAPGPYGVALHEVLQLPCDVMGLVVARSSLLRCGAWLGGAWVDAGYQGQPEALLVVHNPAGLRLAVGAAICQVAFFPLSEMVEGYQGAYQGQVFSA